jgi:hypothetical protein
MKTLFTTTISLLFSFLNMFGNSTDPIKGKIPSAISLECPSDISTTCALPAAYANLQAFLDAGGDFTVTTSVDTMSFRLSNEVIDDCEITRTYSLREKGGSTTTCTQLITVTNDIENPVARCRNITINLAGTTGNVQVTPQMLNANSTDNCGINSVCFLTTTGTNCNNQVIGCNDIGQNVNITLLVTDNCGLTSTCSSIVSVSTCPPPRNKAINANCSLTIPNVVSNLNLFQFCQRNVTLATQNPPAGTIIPMVANNQVVIVQIIVSNGGGLRDTCYMDIIAKDSIGPSIICKPGIINALSGGFVFADTLFQSTNDNCSSSLLRFSVRRSGLGCDGQPSVFAPYAEFCCADVGQSRSLIVQASDNNGNTATCLRQVRVRDNNPPSISVGLPNITINCEYPLNLNNLTAFGTFVKQGSTINDIVINNVIVGRDGVYSNCDGGTVTSTVRDERNLCSQGRIARNFVITDLSGNIATFTQYIYISDINPFGINDIKWPAKTINYNSCSSVTPLTSITGVATVANDRCSKADVSFKDQKFVNNVCGFIRRTWTVIDWCQYMPNVPTSLGKWTYVQTINYVNTVQPTFTGRTCRDTTICVGTNCMANVSFAASATDDCQPVQISYSFAFDHGNNNTIDLAGSTNSFNRTLPVGMHSVTWTVKDKCLNSRSCKSVVTVKDCSIPSVVLRNGLVATLNPQTKSVTLWANDFVLSGTDNCTPTASLKYSFVNNNTSATSRVFTCADKGTKNIDIYTTDLAGNTAKLTTTINIQDNFNVCPSLKDGSTDDLLNRSNTFRISSPNPNPYSHNCSFEVESHIESIALWSIWGVDGRILHSSSTTLLKGLNYIDVEQGGATIPAGTYFIKVSVGDQTQTFRVSKI